MKKESKKQLPLLEATGAPSALKWIAEQEAKARRRFESAEKALELALKNAAERPPETDGEDYQSRIYQAQSQRDDALDNWNKLAEKLLKFDKSVDTERRDTSESITRDDGSRLFTLAAIYLRSGIETLITTYAQDVLTCDRPEQVVVMLADKLRESLNQSLLAATRESHLADWVRHSVMEGL